MALRPDLESAIAERLAKYPYKPATSRSWPEHVPFPEHAVAPRAAIEENMNSIWEQTQGPGERDVIVRAWSQGNPVIAFGDKYAGLIDLPVNEGMLVRDRAKGRELLGMGAIEDHNLKYAFGYRYSDPAYGFIRGQVPIQGDKFYAYRKQYDQMPLERDNKVYTVPTITVGDKVRPKKRKTKVT